MTKSHLLNTPGASVYLGIPARTLEDLRLRGGGPRYVRIGRRVRYLVSSLDAWVLAHERASTSDLGTEGVT